MPSPLQAWLNRPPTARSKAASSTLATANTRRFPQLPRIVLHHHVDAGVELGGERDASGKVILGSNGRPLLIVPTTDALGASQRTFIDRGMRAEKEYLRLFPSINASYNVRENLVARAAFYTSVGRPDYNQYAGGVTLPDTENPPSNSNRISVNNVAIKAWSPPSMMPTTYRRSTISQTPCE